MSFWCDKGVGVVNVSYEFRPSNAAEGVQVDILLSAGDVALPAIHTAGHPVLGDNSFNLEGQFEFSDRFVELVSSAGPLTVLVEGKTSDFSLSGASEAARPLIDTCSRR